MEDRLLRDCNASSALGSATAAAAGSVGADAVDALGVSLALAEPLFQKARLDHRLALPALLDWLPLLVASCSHV